MVKSTNMFMVLTIELTSNCNAVCAGCTRHSVKEPIPKNINLDIDIFKTLIDDTKDTADRIIIDGSYGDSPMHPKFLEMIEYITIVNPTTNINISTNGSYKSTKFWHGLGVILKNFNHSVQFDLDGIDNETQLMYRGNTNFDKIIGNAKAFIDGGGQAVWKMIPFEWNNGLEDKAANMAEELGFKLFRRNRVNRYKAKAPIYAIAKKMNIPLTGIEYESMDKEIITKEVEKASKMEMPIDINLDLRENIDKILESKAIECKWKQTGSYQVSHDGTVWRCCWLETHYHYERNKETDRDMWNYFTGKYDPQWNSIYSHSFTDIIQHEFFTNDLPDSFNNDGSHETNPRLKICSKMCSVVL